MLIMWGFPGLLLRIYAHEIRHPQRKPLSQAPWLPGLGAIRLPGSRSRWGFRFFCAAAWCNQAPRMGCSSDPVDRKITGTAYGFVFIRFSVYCSSDPVNIEYRENEKGITI
jgi:hypothetical protein